jgi:hypothetical protein
MRSKFPLIAFAIKIRLIAFTIKLLQASPSCTTPPCHSLHKDNALFSTHTREHHPPSVTFMSSGVSTAIGSHVRLRYKYMSYYTPFPVVCSDTGIVPLHPSTLCPSLHPPVSTNTTLIAFTFNFFNFTVESQLRFNFHSLIAIAIQFHS